MKVAFATQDLKRVDAHFGWAKNIAIYDLDPEGYRFVETVEFDGDLKEDGNEDKLAPKIEAIKDCAILYVAAIGGSGAARVVANNIHPMKVTQPEEITDLLGKLQAVLKGTPPPWLRKALANEEFELFYQPLVNLKSGKISTCEALLRWNHPVRGTVSPVDIIPVAEDMGLIVDLGRWILRKACLECMKWPDAVSVAVNFSPQQFHQRDVLSEVRYALEVSGLPPHRLEIEITESSLLRNTQLTHDVLSQLHMLGVRISLDDFGTGYSSLSYLHNFPLEKVKIDRSFLEGIDTDRPLTLLRGVARLSADLGMSVVVEGIETNEQLELVSADGTVTEAQGYLFSRPVPAIRIRQLLNASHGRRMTDEAITPLNGIRSIA
ncbi:MAG: nitrogen fixation protein NifX [Bradyrhizobium sp.]|nr:nitrogen fixation protein NifX [Bradyrhizobium sp.]